MIETWSSTKDTIPSNCWEFENLVCAIEKALESGELQLFIGKVAETLLYKGNFTSKKPYDLVIRLKCVELKFGSKLLITDVSGKYIG